MRAPRPLSLVFLLAPFAPVAACGGASPAATPVVATPLAVPPPGEHLPEPPPPLPADPADLTAVAAPMDGCKLAAAAVEQPLELASSADGTPFARVATGSAKITVAQGGAVFADVTAPTFGARGFVPRRTPALHARRWVSFGGVVFAAAQDRLGVQSARDGKVVVEAPPSSFVTLAEAFRTSEVACDDLSIAQDADQILSRDVPPAFQPRGTSRTMLAKAHTPMALSAEPGGPTVATIAEEDAPYTVIVLEQKGALARVRRGHAAGWVDAKLLSSPKPAKKKGVQEFGMIGLLGTGGGGLYGAGGGAPAPAADVTTLVCAADVRLVTDGTKSGDAAPRFLVATIPAGAPVPVLERGADLAALAPMTEAGLRALTRLAVPTRDLSGCKEAKDGAALRTAALPTRRDPQPDAIDRTDEGTSPLEARGNMWGDSIGDAFGAGGLGLTGSGVGTIGLGSIGTIGHGSASTASTGTAPTLRQGATTVNGLLPPEVIQRIVRQNFGRFRLCYENGLRTKPTLQGRVSVKFTIDQSGTTTSAGDAGSDLPDSGVVSCVVRGFSNLSFPQPESGIVLVTYPIIFSPGTKPAKK